MIAVVLAEAEAEQLHRVPKHWHEAGNRLITGTPITTTAAAAAAPTVAVVVAPTAATFAATATTTLATSLVVAEAAGRA